MTNEIIEKAQRCDSVAAALWACSGLLLTWDSAHSRTPGGGRGVSRATEWGLFLSAAAAARTVQASDDRSTTRMISTLTRLLAGADEPARRSGMVQQVQHLRRVQQPGPADRATSQG